MPNAEGTKKKVIVYRRDSQTVWRGVAGLQVFTSPISFLARAMGGDCGRLVVFLEWSTRLEKEALLELCTVLRASPVSRDLTLGCILHEPHREVLAGLAKAEVAWVWFLSAGQPILPILLMSPESVDGKWLRLEKVLREICPYLNYLPVEGGRGMCVCGAYRNRMVLGQGTLRALCRVARHNNCPYFLDPHPADTGAGRRA
ncbi:MAG: hypothetical protein KMY53_13590 [Desulfarculus sp.]|nr:hypothetical protein [Pseudomonadota bacterium]MBV1739195.1 hypothetical protein [Desulfarculus sp.]